jgi:hypothetical protein
MTAIRMHRTGGTRAGFTAWRRRRPFMGGLLLALSGIEMFLSGQLDLGHIRIQMGFEGFQATVIPALLVVLGVLVVVSPAQRMFSGVFALILAVYSLIGVNLGGFVLGMLLGAVGGVMTVAWRPKTAAQTAGGTVAETPSDAEGHTATATAPAPGPAPRAVHAEAVDYAELRARADARRRTGSWHTGIPSSDVTTPPAEPRPFARRRP